MTREEASNILWWASKRHYPGDQMDITEYDIEAFNMAIAALRGWVKTAERLPEDNSGVKYFVVHIMGFHEQEEDAFGILTLDDLRYYRGDEYDYYMPLPELPEVDDD